MTDDSETAETVMAAAPLSVGAELKQHRLNANLDLNDIGSRTRIPLRHLESIERDDFAALPSPTYAIGFTKAYARALGEDENRYLGRLRETLNRPLVETPARDVFYASDGARVPSRAFAWTALIIAALIVGGYGVWRSGMFGSSDPQVTVSDYDPSAPQNTMTLAPDSDGADRSTPATGETATDDTADPSATGNVSGAASGMTGTDNADAADALPGTADVVVLTALDPVWVRITDGEQRLYEGELATGKSYQLPAGVRDPRILTGRPEQLRVTVGGQTVAPLGPPAHTVRNVSLAPAALRGQTGTAQSGGTGASTGQPSASAVPSAGGR